ncbi:MAG: hypothetical protein IT239_03940 [Bacteroidia bacterium]|nr:hypothetical protein [Bacteroidia bacterium]
MKKIIVLLLAVMFMSEACVRTKTSCGSTKKQAKNRHTKMKKMAPGMVY